MKNPILILTHSEATRERLLSFVHQTQGAHVGIKIAALLLTLEGQRPGWICEILGMSRQKIRQELQEHLEKSPSEFGLNRVQWDGPTLVVHLKRHFGITLKVRQAQAWMHQLGYRMKRA